MKTVLRFSRPMRIALAAVYTLLALFVCTCLPWSSCWTAVWIGIAGGEGVGIWQKALRG